MKLTPFRERGAHSNGYRPLRGRYKTHIVLPDGRGDVCRASREASDVPARVTGSEFLSSAPWTERYMLLRFVSVQQNRLTSSR
jgi:hypothetical protein